MLATNTNSLVKETSDNDHIPDIHSFPGATAFESRHYRIVKKRGLTTKYQKKFSIFSFFFPSFCIPGFLNPGFLW